MKPVFALITVLLSASVSGHAGSFSMMFDNDFLYKSDDAYTGGWLINWLSDEYSDANTSAFSQSYIKGYRTLLEPLHAPGTERSHHNASISLHQAIITPDNTDASAPNYDDLPYVGILNLSLAYYAWDANTFDEYRFVVGTIGPNAGAKYSQKLVHKVTGNSDPQGWNTQLDNSWFAGVGYMHGLRLLQRPLDGSVDLELFGSYNVDVGNHYAGANGGINLRVGKNVPNTFHSVSTLLGVSNNRQILCEPLYDTTGWSLHAGVYLNYIGYMKIIEEAKDLGYNIDDEPLFPTGNIGADLYLERWQVSFDLFPTRLYTGKTSSGSWSRLTIIYYY